MEGKGFTGVMAGNLSIIFEDKDWGIIIRHKSDKSWGPFCDFHLKVVTANDIKRFIPNWQKLEWKKCAEDPLFPVEYFSEDEEFKINLSKGKDSKTSDEQMIKEFNDFMKEKT